MNRCHTSLLCALVVLALTNPVFADEPKTEGELTLSAELVFGPFGPVRRASYFPGDTILFEVSAQGVATNSKDELTAQFDFELINEAGTHVDKPINVTMKYDRTIHAKYMLARGWFVLPLPARAEKLILVANVRETSNGRTAKVEVPIEVVEPTSPYPIGAHFEHFEHGVPAAGYFTVNQNVALKFAIGGLHRLDEKQQCTCVLKLVGKDQAVVKRHEIAFRTKTPADQAMAAFFNFFLDAPFEGVARVEVTSDLDDKTYAVELPIRFLPALKAN